MFSIYTSLHLSLIHYIPVSETFISSFHQKLTENRTMGYLFYKSFTEV